jgi:hypothetical protein
MPAKDWWHKSTRTYYAEPRSRIVDPARGAPACNQAAIAHVFVSGGGAAN